MKRVLPAGGGIASELLTATRIHLLSSDADSEAVKERLERIEVELKEIKELLRAIQ